VQTDVKDLNTFTRMLTVQVSSQELLDVEKRVINKIKKTATLPGFRKGKVPISIIKKRYADQIKLELIEDSISEYYTKALQDAHIRPVTKGKINNVDFEDIEKGLKFEIEIEIEPEIELKKHKGLKVEREVPVVTDKMRADALNSIREQFSTVKEMDTVKEGFNVNLDAQKLGEGDVPVVGQKFEDLKIKVGSGEFDSDFEKQLLGLKKDSQAIIRKNIPSKPQEEHKKPISESYQVTVKAIEENELPPLNDDFLKNLQDNDLKTIEQFKDRINNNLRIELERRSREQFVSRLIDELLKENPFDVPPSMVDHYLDHLVQDIKNQSKGENIDESLIRQDYKPYAIHNIRWYLLKQKLVKAENINVEQNEIHSAINQMKIDDTQKEQFKKNKQVQNRIKEDLLEQKVINLLESNAEIVEVYPQDSLEVK
jgi:trigger factor